MVVCLSNKTFLKFSLYNLSYYLVYFTIFSYEALKSNPFLHYIQKWKIWLRILEAFKYSKSISSFVVCSSSVINSSYNCLRYVRIILLIHERTFNSLKVNPECVTTNFKTKFLKYNYINNIFFCLFLLKFKIWDINLLLVRGRDFKG